MDCIGIKTYDRPNHYYKSKPNADYINDIETDRSVKRFLSMKRTEDLRREAIENQKRRQVNGKSPFFFIQQPETDAEESFSTTCVHAPCKSNNNSNDIAQSHNSNNISIEIAQPHKSYSEYMLGKRACRDEQASNKTIGNGIYGLKSILKSTATEQQQQDENSDKQLQQKKVTFSETIVVQQVDSETRTTNVTNYKVDSNFKLPKNTEPEDDSKSSDSDDDDDSSKFVTWKSNLLANEKVKTKQIEQFDEPSTDDTVDEVANESVDEISDETDDTKVDTDVSVSDNVGDSRYVDSQHLDRKPNFELSKLKIGDMNADYFMMGDCTIETACLQLSESQQLQIQHLQEQLKARQQSAQAQNDIKSSEVTDTENAQEAPEASESSQQPTTEETPVEQIATATSVEKPPATEAVTTEPPIPETKSPPLMKEKNMAEIAIEQRPVCFSKSILTSAEAAAIMEGKIALQTLFQRSPPLNMLPTESRQTTQCFHQRSVRSNYKVYSGRGRSRSSSRQRYGKKQMLPPLRDRRGYPVNSKKRSEFSWIRALAILFMILVLMCLIVINLQSLSAAYKYVSSEIYKMWASRLQMQPKEIRLKKSFLARFVEGIRRWLPF